VTLYFAEQNVLISWFEPGFLPPKLFAGIPTITKPRSLYFHRLFQVPAYCGVNPQRLATLTSKHDLTLEFGQRGSVRRRWNSS